MKILQTLLLSFVGLTVLSCNQAPTTNDKTTPADNAQETVIKASATDTITNLLDKALMSDTLEFNNEFVFNSWKSFLFFKSGHLLNNTEKNAIIVHCLTDTTYSIKLYSIRDSKWILSDSLNGLDAFPTQFDPIFDDYNFDGQTDIYIQVSASNGYSLSRGNLLIIDPLTKKLNFHGEARELANMKPDPKTKTVISELWNGYDLKDNQGVTIITNKWTNGKLKTISKKDITIN